jgi:hypothetical protein
MTDTVVSLLPLLVCLAVVTGIVLLIVLPIRARSRKRDADLAAQWEWIKSEASSRRGYLAFVRVVYQRARTGTKALIVWDGVTWDQDTWFKGRDQRVGVFVLVQGRSGWGPHNRNPNVFYVASGGFLAEVSGDAPAAHRRHHERRATRDKRAATRS